MVKQGHTTKKRLNQNLYKFKLHARPSGTETLKHVTVCVRRFGDREIMDGVIGDREIIILSEIERSRGRGLEVARDRATET